MSLENSSSIFDELKVSSIQPPMFDMRSSQEGYLELAGSIMRQGLLQPIIVRPRGDKFELIAGSRRLAACRSLGWRTIPCQIVELTDQECFEVALSENIARRTLDPLEEAKAFQDYVVKYGWGSERDLARKIGKSPIYISKRIGLLNLPEASLRQLFRRRKNPSLAEEILALEDTELRTHLINLSAELNLTSKDVRRLRHRLKMEDMKDDNVWPNSSYGNYDRRNRVVKNSILRTVTALRVALSRLDDVIANIDEENWVLKEILLEQRSTLHSQIDLVYNLTKRIEKMFPSGCSP